MQTQYIDNVLFVCFCKQPDRQLLLFHFNQKMKIKASSTIRLKEHFWISVVLFYIQKMFSRHVISLLYSTDKECQHCVSNEQLFLYLKYHNIMQSEDSGYNICSASYDVVVIINKFGMSVGRVRMFTWKKREKFCSFFKAPKQLMKIWCLQSKNFSQISTFQGRVKGFENNSTGGFCKT